jgi:tetratricopeptide (TPR) repeat protein
VALKKKKNKSNDNLLLRIKATPAHHAMPVTYGEAMNIASRGMNLNRFEVVEFQLRQIAKLMPKEIQPRLMLLKCYVGTGAEDEALQVISELQKLAPYNVQMLTNLGQYYQSAGDGQKSVDCLLRASKLEPKNGRLAAGLAMSYSSIGEKEKALQLFDRSIALWPENGSAYFQRALLIKGKRSASRIKKMESALMLPNIEPVQKGLVHLALAWAYDKNDTERQFEHLEKGNNIIADVYPWDEKRQIDEFNCIKNYFLDINYEIEQGRETIVDRPVFIAAMPRSGTTMLEQVLGAHSEAVPIGESQLISFSMMHAIHHAGLKPNYYLIDNEKDSDELVNEFFNSKYRDIVRRLGKGMLNYVKSTKDPYGDLPYLQHDLQWAAEGKAAGGSQAGSR